MSKKWSLMVGLMAVAGLASAAEVEVDGGIYSSYIWRGMCLDNRPVAQGGVTVSHEKGFYGNVWGNNSLSDDFVGPDYDGLNEVDYTAGYGGTFGAVDYDVGYIYYSFPNTDYESTQEVYGGLALNNLPVTPSVYAYHDFDQVEGWYVIADLNYSRDLTESLGMELGASLAWGDSNYHEAWYGDSSTGLSDCKVYAGLSYALTDNLSLNGSLSCSFYPDGDLAEDAESSYSHDTNLFGGIGLTYSF